MNQVVDIRELNELIEQKSTFLNVLTDGMSKLIVGQQHLVESLIIALLSDRLCIFLLLVQGVELFFQ